MLELLHGSEIEVCHKFIFAIGGLDISGKTVSKWSYYMLIYLDQGFVHTCDELLGCYIARSVKLHGTLYTEVVLPPQIHPLTLYVEILGKTFSIWFVYDLLILASSAPAENTHFSLLTIF